MVLYPYFCGSKNVTYCNIHFENASSTQFAARNDQFVHTILYAQENVNTAKMLFGASLCRVVHM